MSILAKAFNSARILLSFQLALKLINFSLGIIIARIVNPDIYGEGNIQVTLISSAILHLSRETFRRVALKSNSSPYGLMWLSVFTTCGISFLTFLFLPSSETLIICLAASIEVLCEPFQIMQMSNFEIKGRILAEALSTITNGVIIILTHSQGVIAFCYGQLGASLMNCVTFIYFCKIWPLSLHISASDKSLSLTYFGIALVKFFLSEGEKIFLTAMTFSSTEQGVFALVSNLSSIVCRMVFLPIEEISHLVFVKELSPQESQQGVRSVMRFMWLVGLVVAVYAQIYADVVIRILYGKNWENTGAGEALAAYCWYVLAMGINGVSEAISSGISTQEQLERRKIGMTACFL